MPHPSRASLPACLPACHSQPKMPFKAQGAPPPFPRATPTSRGPAGLPEPRGVILENHTLDASVDQPDWCTREAPADPAGPFLTLLLQQRRWPACLPDCLTDCDVVCFSCLILLVPHPSHPSSFVVVLLLLLALALALILALTCSILVALASGVSYAATTQGLWWSSSATMKFAAMQARESCTVGASRGVRRELPQPRAREALGISLVSPWRRRMALCPWTTVERMAPPPPMEAS